MKNNVTYNITTSQQYTVDEFIQYWQSIVPKDAQPISASDFLQIKRNETGPKNIDVAYKAYDKLDQEKYKDDYASGSIPFIPKGVTMAFPIVDTTIMLQEAVNQKQFLSQGDFQTYWSENYQQLISDPEYQPINYISYVSSNESLFVRYHSLNVRVWIYMKSIDKVIDVSPYVTDMSVIKIFTGSSFTINIVPFKDSTIKKGSGNYFDIINTVTGHGYEFKSFLGKFLQTNDIVFIRFERLEVERGKEQDYTTETLEIPKNKLANSGENVNVWDMIGIIDNCTEVFSAESNMKMTSITGRDIEKLFVEDGSYFLPLREIEGSEDLWWYCGGTNDSWFKRNIITGDFKYLWSYEFKKIDQMVFFIINIMSNLGLVQGNLFDSWNNARTTSYEVTGAPTLEVKGIWQIVKVFVEDAVKQRAVVDSSIGNPNGTLMDYMNRICQYPFVEFFFDTYINTIDIIVRQPPFTEKAIKGIVSSKQYITINAQDTIGCNLTYDSRVYSWYQVHMQNSVSGSNEYASLAFIPIVYLNNYAEIWGNRKLEVTDIYMRFEEKKGIEDTEKLSTMQAAVLNDLLFLIETNAYLPFTRTGTIEINGDRRIKVGTFVYCEFTNELFYVTGVTNTISFSDGGLERRTVLQVERGMYFPCLSSEASPILRKDNSFPIETPSSEKGDYFKIVQLDVLKEAIEKAQSGEKVSVQNPIVDQTQFEYFLNRKMFIE